MAGDGRQLNNKIPDRTEAREKSLYDIQVYCDFLKGEKLPDASDSGDNSPSSDPGKSQVLPVPHSSDHGSSSSQPAPTPTEEDDMNPLEVHKAAQQKKLQSKEILRESSFASEKERERRSGEEAAERDRMLSRAWAENEKRKKSATQYRPLREQELLDNTVDSVFKKERLNQVRLDQERLNQERLKSKAQSSGHGFPSPQPAPTPTEQGKLRPLEVPKILKHSPEPEATSEDPSLSGQLDSILKQETLLEEKFKTFRRLKMEVIEAGVTPRTDLDIVEPALDFAGWTKEGSGEIARRLGRMSSEIADMSKMLRELCDIYRRLNRIYLDRLAQGDCAEDTESQWSMEVNCGEDPDGSSPAGRLNCLSPRSSLRRRVREQGEQSGSPLASKMSDLSLGQMKDGANPAP